MTFDKEMKDLSAKAAKASRKEENCKNNAHVYEVFCLSALRPRCGKKAFGGTSNPKSWIYVEQVCAPICKNVLPARAGSTFT